MKTFLFTDIEGSTPKWVADETAMAASLRLHDEVVRDVVDTHHGTIFTTGGDGFGVVFDAPGDAVAAALDAQRRLAAMAWSGPALAVRMGIHAGDAEARDGDYFGLAVTTAARVMDAGHGGQILATDPVVHATALAVRDLGSHRLRGVDAPIRIHQCNDGHFAPLRVVHPGLVTLPAVHDRFIGRDGDIRRVRARLSDHRLVTITGVGGSGKTRLAITAATAEIPVSPDGVRFVDLSSLNDPERVPSVILNAVSSTSPDPASAAAFDGLLVVDNCEHVIDDVAEVLTDLLACRGPLRVLATSREALDIAGEHVVPLRPLATDGPDAPAVRLFLDRADAAGADVARDAKTIDAVIELCERLDGMPLAIELAAARTPVLSPQQMLERIGDRFALLSGRRRRRNRTRTLEATIDWSFQLLDAAEQSLFLRCSVFEGSFDIVGVAGVAGVDELTAVDLVGSLVAKSLLVPTTGESGTRFRMLETIRAFAEDRLAQSGAAAETQHQLARTIVDRYPVDVDDADRGRETFALRDDLDNIVGAVSSALDRGERDLAIELYARLAYSAAIDYMVDLTHLGFDTRLQIDPQSTIGGYIEIISAAIDRAATSSMTECEDRFLELTDHPSPIIRTIAALHAWQSRFDPANDQAPLPPLPDTVDLDSLPPYWRCYAEGIIGFTHAYSGDNEVAAHRCRAAAAIADELGYETNISRQSRAVLMRIAIAAEHPDVLEQIGLEAVPATWRTSLVLLGGDLEQLRHSISEIDVVLRTARPGTVIAPIFAVDVAAAAAHVGEPRVAKELLLVAAHWPLGRRDIARRVAEQLDIVDELDERRHAAAIPNSVLGAALRNNIGTVLAAIDRAIAEERNR